MFAKAFISPKNSTPKSFLHTSDSLRSPKVRESDMRSTATNKSKHNGNSEHRDSFCTKEISHLDNESLLSTQIGSNSNLAIEAGPSLSIITEVAGGGRDGSSAAYFNEKYCKKVLEEMHALRQELEQKNGVITKLSKENDNLRREMEEFLTAVDDAREYIDVELKECNQRIQDLENEIHEVREENKQYKKELEKRGNEMFPSQKEIAGLLQQEVDGFFAVSQKDTEDFYFRLNEQIAEFLGNSKEKYQDFSKNIQHKIQNAKKETAVKIEQPKPSKVIPDQTSPLRSLKQSHNPSRGRIQSPKASQSMSLAKKSSKKNLDNFLSLTNEISSPTSYGLYNASPGHASIRQFDKQYEESTNFLSDFDKSKRNSYLASPSKSALLRTKLKSDAILIEMKKKLAGL